jgi:Leucine-rich repeat (LRR) protein
MKTFKLFILYLVTFAITANGKRLGVIPQQHSATVGFFIINSDTFSSVKEYLNSNKSLEKVTSLEIDNFPTSEVLSLKNIDTSLKFVKFTANQKSFTDVFTDFKPFSGKLINVERLDIYSDTLSENYSGYLIFSNLKHLVIVCPTLKKISTDIVNLNRLNYIMLDGCPIKEIPRNINKLTNLKELWITGSDITLLPKELGDLKKLKILQLASNHYLQTIEIGALRCDSLSIISFDSCDALKTFLPDEISGLKKLRGIFLGSIPIYDKLKITELRSKLNNVTIND